MTTPGGVQNLPHGALTPETLAFQIQDMSATAFRARSGERMPTIFGTSTGGDIMSDASPFGVIAKLFSGFSSVVAQADPADIQGPNDLPHLLIDFIESLPMVGQFIDLLDALQGKYTGDDPTLIAIQELMAPLWTLGNQITQVIESIWNGTGGLGEVIGSIFDPSHTQQAMEETQRRIAAAVAAIIGIGGTTVNFGELPPGPNLPGWHCSHIAGTGGSLIVQDGQLRIVGDVGIGGTRWRAILTEKVPTQADVRVDAVFGSAPGFLSGSTNRIIARSDDGDNYAFARLLSARGDLGVCVNGQETILESSGMTFSPAVPYTLVAHGSTLELRRDGQLIGEPAVDSRVGALTGRHVGAEFFSALTIDQCGGLSALGFRNYTAAL